MVSTRTTYRVCRIFTTAEYFDFRAKGYGDYCSQDGHGVPVMIEKWNNKLMVVIWGDINQKDPTHTISLEGAKENRRK